MAALPSMRPTGWFQVAWLSSIAASNTHRWSGAYAVTKSADDHMMMLAADELGPTRSVWISPARMNLALFLLNDTAEWITGQVIKVDGGHMLRRGSDFSAMLERNGDLAGVEHVGQPNLAPSVMDRTCSAVCPVRCRFCADPLR
jgi:hypothetical protein